jgi:integrase
MGTNREPENWFPILGVIVKYKQTASTINRRKKAGKFSDGHGLFYRRNGDGSLSAWQRLISGGDQKVAGPALGEITTEWVLQSRESGAKLKGLSLSGVTLCELWTMFTAEVMKSATPIWQPVSYEKLNNRMLKYVGATPAWQRPADSLLPLDIADALADLRAAYPKILPDTLNNLRRAYSWGLTMRVVNSNPAELYRNSLRESGGIVAGAKHPAITDLAKLGEILRWIEGSNLSGSVRAALTLQAFTAQRSNEIAGIEWAEYEDGLLSIPRARMKIKDWSKKPYDQVLVLPESMDRLIRQLPKTSPYMFPQKTNTSKPIAKQLLPHAYNHNGYKNIHRPHSWRSALDTNARAAERDDESPLFAPSWIEDVLDHAPSKLQASYKRGPAVRGVGRVLAWWADELLTAKEGKANA